MFIITAGIMALWCMFLCVVLALKLQKLNDVAKIYPVGTFFPPLYGTVLALYASAFTFGFLMVYL